MKINIQNMSDDLHEFSEQVEPVFLSKQMHDLYPEVLQVDVTLDKFGRDYRLDIHIRTHGHYICDRCLAPFEREFEARMLQIYQMGPLDEGLDEEVLELAPNAVEIDIDPVLSEMIILNHPVKMLCSEDCKGICPNCGADLNHEACRCGSVPMDPRWEELRKLIK